MKNKCNIAIAFMELVFSLELEIPLFVDDGFIISRQNSSIIRTIPTLSSACRLCQFQTNIHVVRLSTQRTQVQAVMWLRTTAVADEQGHNNIYRNMAHQWKWQSENEDLQLLYTKLFFIIV